jgi:hypothetical protein
MSEKDLHEPVTDQPADLGVLGLSPSEERALLQRVRGALPRARRITPLAFITSYARQIAIAASCVLALELAVFLLLPWPRQAGDAPDEALVQLLTSASLEGRNVTPEELYLHRVPEVP